MKKYLLIAIIIFSSLSKRASAQTDPIYDSISLLNLDHYATLPVDSFLHAIPQSYNSIKIMPCNNHNKACGLSIYYPNNLNILIKPIHYLFMPQIDPNHIWNLTLFKKETAHYILVIAPQASLWGQDDQ